MVWQRLADGIETPARMGIVSDKEFASRRAPSRPCARGLSLILAGVLLLIFSTGALAVDLSPAETARIGQRIWENECGGTVAGLTSWNVGENFASLGIGHFIWYPAGSRGPFEESFPPFLEFASSRGAKLPEFLSIGGDHACPWGSRAEFGREIHSPKIEQLRQFLRATINLQAEFLVKRLEQALPKMTRELGAGEREKIQQRFNEVAHTAAGCYALVDYVNFKGEGVLATERYQGQGWGLLQVLERMPGNAHGAEAVREFSASAKAVLQQRVRNAPPERKESRWLPGWLNRVRTYSR